jgi:C4-dicarboxylate transporter DctQ subunit
LGRIRTIIDRGIFCIIVFIVAVLTATSFFQVVARYVFHRPPSWSEEVVRYLFIWLVFLATSVGFRRGSHLGVDFFVGLLPPKVRKAVEVGIHLFLGLLLAVVTWQGVVMTGMVKFQLSPAMRISMSWIYAAIPVGGFFMLLEVVSLFLKSLKRR